MNEENDIKAIVDFMGIKETEIFYEWYGVKTPIFYVLYGSHKTITYGIAGKAMEEFILYNRFKTEWNWLMPVVEKICKRQEISISYRTFRDIGDDRKFLVHSNHKNFTAETAIQATYDAVVNFINEKHETLR